MPNKIHITETNTHSRQVKQDDWITAKAVEKGTKYYTRKMEPQETNRTAQGRKYTAHQGTKETDHQHRKPNTQPANEPYIK
jgi:hypothetical protein